MMKNIPVGLSSGSGVPYQGFRLGIELEYEGVSESMQVRRYKWWRATHDPSLRMGGCEFVSYVLADDEVDEAIAEIGIALDEFGPLATPRCGTHIHVNVSSIKWQQLWNLTTLYMLVEPALFEKHCKGRDLNHFCVPMWANTGQTRAMSKDVQRLYGQDPQMPFLVNCNKYAALNYKSLTNLGTLEFRMFPATTDAAKLAEWCKLVALLYRGALEYEDHLQILQDYEDLDREDFLAPFGLDGVKEDEEHVEDAETTAVLMSGYVPIEWQQLNWEGVI